MRYRRGRGRFRRRVGRGRRRFGRRGRMRLRGIRVGYRM